MITGPVLVTGASSGIGLETALHLAQQGFTVCATVRDLSRRDKLDAEMQRRDLQLEVRQLDVTDTDSIGTTVCALVAHYGSIFGLVSNAGIQLRGCFEDCSEEEVRHIFEVNLYGAMAVTRAVLPHMRAACCGRIVLITSAGGLLGAFANSAYCATKFALEGFGEALAQEVAPLGIAVTMVEPAIIRTDFWTRNRNIAAGTQNTSSPYYRWFQELECLSDRLVATSPTRTEAVARVVHKALTAQQPKLRYLVGGRARLAIALRRIIPGELFERLYFAAVMRQVTRSR